jgi:hypothetical protein
MAATTLATAHVRATRRVVDGGRSTIGRDDVVFDRIALP